MPCTLLQLSLGAVISITIPILKVFELNTNINSNTSEFEKGYQYRYQYLRSLNSITIPISIPKFSKFNIKLNTIPKYLDTLRSQDNIKKTRAGIAHLCTGLQQLELIIFQLYDFWARLILGYESRAIDHWSYSTITYWATISIKKPWISFQLQWEQEAWKFSSTLLEW